ncbi:MAG: AI-2E family transporter [Muribaculaceae bacterium]
MIEERRKYDFDRVVRILFAVACVVAVVYLINYLSGVLLPFFVACLLAYIIHPLVKFNKRWMHCNGNVLPVVVTLLMVVMVISAALYVLLPYIYDETGRMVAMLGEYTSKRLDVKYLPPELVEFLRQHVDVNEIVNLLSKEQWMKLLGDVFKETWQFVGATANVIMNILSWFIAVLYLIFILIDYEKVSKGFSRAIPHRYRSGVFDVVSDVKRAMNMYFRGQALIAFIVGILFAIGFSLVGFPMAVVLGLFIGLLNLVPYLQLISIPIAFFLCLVDAVATGSNFWALCGWTTVVYCVVQAFQDLYLTPRIMGKYMAINPLLILLSLSIWGSLLGFVGLIIALPLTALLLSYYKQYVLTMDGENEVLAKSKKNGVDAPKQSVEQHAE